jgi:predicted transcriptional regulator
MVYHFCHNVKSKKEKLPMGMTEKIKILLVKKNMKAAHLARMLDTPPSNLYRKFERDNFTEKELTKIAETLGCKYEGFFFLDNGDKV